ncbi:MAG: DUF4157 domain-containing protein [Fibrobacter sp.]|nr:DUF4157 domain-containing protein [Fibrobacter sp.]
MHSTYAQTQKTAQKKEASTAAAVLDASSQSEGLQRKADMMNNAAQRAEAPRPNNTGMPDNLKAGIESLSGFSMDDVRVHYNSSKPATVQALAYTQGTDIHVAPGQEKHLPHEAWHVAQQMAGRVSPTTNINGMPVNDNAALEHEADVMGEKAVQCRFNPNVTQRVSICKNNFKHCTQRFAYIATRPLQALPGISTHFRNNMNICHSQIFINENSRGQNFVCDYGFHTTNTRNPISGPGALLINDTSHGYVLERTIYNNDPSHPNYDNFLFTSLLNAIATIGTNGRFNHYNLFTNNCQDWTDAVLIQYNNFVGQRGRISRPNGIINRIHGR